MMYKLNSLIKMLFLCCIALLISCSSSYEVQKSNRHQYAINQNLPADSAVINTYQPYKQQLDAEMNQMLGTSEVEMIKNSAVPETLLGNFFSDVALHQALKLVPDIDFAMPSTKGGLRANLPRGPIRLTNVFELMPFENELVVVDLKGEDVADLLNYIAFTNGQPVARLRMKIVDRKPTQVYIKGKPFDPSRSYRILTSDYIAEGGDDVNSFKKGLTKKNIGLKVRDALVKYITENQAAGKSLNPILDGRITND